MWISFDQVDQFEPKTLNLGLLVVESDVDLLDLLLDQTELLIGQVSVLWPKLVQVELLLLSSRSLHLSLFLVDRHVQDLVEVRDSLQDPRLNDIKHNCILQFDSQFVPQSLLFPCPLLIVLEHSRVPRDNVIESNRVVLV